MKKLYLKAIVVLVYLMCGINIYKSQNIYTIAGTGAQGWSGDGGLAVNSELNAPTGVAVDATGNVYIVAGANHRVRKVDLAGLISNFAGMGFPSNSGDGFAAANAPLNNPFGVTVDASDNIYIADKYNNRIRKVNNMGVILAFAGTGLPGFYGDGSAAIGASLNKPSGVAFDVLGNAYIADYINHRIRKVDMQGIISTIAGTGWSGFSGDGAAATLAQLNAPIGVAVDAVGNIFVAEYLNHRIRKINPAGVISTFAGTGVAGFNGDGGLAVNAQLNFPSGIVVDASGNVLIADEINNRIRKVNQAGVISTIAGIGVSGFSGDGGLAVSAQLSYPDGIAIDAIGNVYIADTYNHRIRKICNGACLVGLNSITENNKVLIFPNPNNGSFKTQVDNEIKNGKVILINSIGEKVHEQKIIQGTNEIITNELPIGLYNYILLQDNQTIKNGKLTIELK